MIYVWLLDHSTHCVFHGPIRKLIISMLFPDSLQVEIWSAHLLLQEGEVSSMRDTLGVIVERVLERGSKFTGDGIRVEILLHNI